MCFVNETGRVMTNYVEETLTSVPVVVLVFAPGGVYSRWNNYVRTVTFAVIIGNNETRDMWT